MSTQPGTAVTFERDRIIEPIYTGGTVALNEDGNVLATSVGEDCLLTDLATGRRLAKVEGVSGLLANLTARC